MDILTCMFMSILMVADGFTVHGPSGPLFAPLGSSVVLPCYVDAPLLIDDLEVEWRKADSETLVHLFQNGESRPEAQHQDYQDKAHFFTDQIQHGNFSIRLDNLTAEDEGQYTCKVDSQQGSGEILVQIKYERLIVSASDQSVFAYDGEDVTLNCSVDSHIQLEDIEVSWIRTDGGMLVLLFENHQTFPDSSHERYRDRAEFFTNEILKGNFSLRLKSVRTEDKGVYMCRVFAGGLSANATVILEQLGFSSWHIAVLFFCFAAGSGVVLLLFSLIYARSKNTVSTSNKIWNLQLSLVFCPNICMFLAFVLWGFTEGSLNETITCCALYILRPVMLIWAMQYLKYLQDSLKTWIKFFRITRELAVFTVVVYSVLFTYGWRKSAHDTSIIPRVLFGIGFGFVLLFCLLLNIDVFSHIWSRGGSPINQSNTNRRVLLCILYMNVYQMIQFIYSFGNLSLDIIVVGFVLFLLVICVQFFHRLEAKFEFLRHRWITLLWIMAIPLVDILLIYILLAILKTEKEYLEWTCVIIFLEVLKMIVAFEVTPKVLVPSRRQETEMSQQGSNAFHLCNEIVYMFGAVGLVLLSSVTLTAELILKARNGERVVTDLRFIVFPSECVFAFYWLVLQLPACWKSVTIRFTHDERNSPQEDHPRNTSENPEMENLTASDPAVSQTQT